MKYNTYIRVTATSTVIYLVTIYYFLRSRFAIGGKGRESKCASIYFEIFIF